jgi:hypothetical protein
MYLFEVYFHHDVDFLHMLLLNCVVFFHMDSVFILHHTLVRSELECSLNLHNYIPVSFNAILSLNTVVKLSNNQSI